MTPKPSIAVWIDPATQEVKTDFMPQTLHPGEYGVVLSMVLVHIARMFVQTNPGATEGELIAEIQRGMEAGLQQRSPATSPLTAH